jgi:hypothetical protein
MVIEWLCDRSVYETLTVPNRALSPQTVSASDWSAGRAFVHPSTHPPTRMEARYASQLKTRRVESSNSTP